MHRSLRALLLISLLGATTVARAELATLVKSYGSCSYGWIEWDLSWGVVPDLCCGWLYRDNDLVARNPPDSNFFAPTPQWYVFLEEVTADMCVPVYHNKQYAIRTEVQHPTQGWYYTPGSTNMPFVAAVHCSGNP
jgi:hypothetical protein